MPRPTHIARFPGERRSPRPVRPSSGPAGPVGFVAGLFVVLALILGPVGCGPSTVHDVIVRGGTVYDGTGSEPTVADVAIDGDRIAAVGDLSDARGRIEIDATDLAVSPGFINMLSWATESLILDGRSMSDVRQGVTLEVFGEGWSMGPLNEEMKAETLEGWTARLGSEERVKGLLGLDPEEELRVPWTSLGEYLEYLEAKGVSPNVASFVGATTVRIHELGYEDRPPTDQELNRMRELVWEAMEEGALGVGSSLIYAPAFYAETDELIALSEVASIHGGIYISHIRSEGNRLLEAVDELMTISEEAKLPAEIYHLKAAGEENWPKLQEVFARVEAARAEDRQITADIYNYTAGATGLDAAMPPWVQEGGYDAWAERLQDPEIRRRVIREMRTPSDEWENLMLAAGPDGVLLVGFLNPELRQYIGMTLAEVAEERGASPEETAIDLVVEDGSRVEAVYFLMSEENLKAKIARPWVAFCSDAGSLAAEEPFTDSSTHPRAYGSFARLLGKYVREEGVVPLEEAIRRLTSFPADNLSLTDRGRLAPGQFADVVVFDPETITDHATYEDPHQYATGVVHVFVNGTRVLADGEHTGEMPGRVVRGPGWTGPDAEDAEPGEGAGDEPIDEESEPEGDEGAGGATVAVPAAALADRGSS